MNCEQYKNIVFDHASDILENDLKTDADGHIAECGTCRKEYEEAKLMLDAVKGSELTPDSRLYDSVMKEIKKTSFNTKLFTRYATVAASLLIVVGLAFSAKYIDVFNEADFEGAETDETIAETYEKEGEIEAETEVDISELNTESSGESDHAGDVTEDKEHLNDVSSSQTDATVTDIEQEIEEDEVIIHYYDYVSSEIEAEKEKISETCDITAANINTYIYVGELAIDYVGVKYDSIDVFYDVEYDIWEVAFYMADDPDNKCVVRFDGQFNVISE